MLLSARRTGVPPSRRAGPDPTVTHSYGPGRAAEKDVQCAGAGSTPRPGAVGEVGVARYWVSPSEWGTGFSKFILVKHMAWGCIFSFKTKREFPSPYLEVVGLF